ncbi:serine hydrolase [Pseudoduganella sp. OTU4001]|uniref:serine hydrolase n=1 Tax=Pseudoduganella sp. OTU4001 TaxID=3043854 RepID=UPI00313EE0C4
MRAFGVVLLALSVAGAARAAEVPLAQRLETAMARMFRADAPGATVIVVKDGVTILRKAYGLADVDAKTPMQPDMQLRLGSVTKQFTAVAIMMLEEQGKLSLHDDITRFLPDYPLKGQRITVEQLLQHTAGIRNYTAMLTYPFFASEDRSVQQMIDYFKDEALEFAPGERWGYSHSGYFLLGAIIEKASGMSYADFLAANIFEPLGMRDTAHEGRERSGKRRVTGYREGIFSGYRPAEPIAMSTSYAAGALVSTVDDLARWDEAISAGKLLSAWGWKQVFTPCSLPSGARCGYGFGWSLGSMRGHRIAAHGGDIPGFNSQSIRLPDDKVFVAVLGNANRNLLNTERIAFTAAAIAVGDPFPQPRAIPMTKLALSTFAGSFRMADNSTRNIVFDGGGLRFERKGRPAAGLRPYAVDKFFLEGTLVTLDFVRGPDGVVSGFTLHGLTGDESAERIVN